MRGERPFSFHPPLMGGSTERCLLCAQQRTLNSRGQRVRYQPKADICNRILEDKLPSLRKNLLTDFFGFFELLLSFIETMSFGSPVTYLMVFLAL